MQMAKSIHVNGLKTIVMPRPTPKIVVLGGINRDYVILGNQMPRPGETILGNELCIGPGGKGANQAVGARRLGASVWLIGAVGSDVAGDALVSGLQKERVDVTHVLSTPRSVSGTALIFVDHSGEKMISAVAGANNFVTVAQIKKAIPVIESANVLLLQLEIPMPTIIAAARAASRAGVTVVLDAGPPVIIPEELWSGIHVLRANSIEAHALTGRRIHDEKSARQVGTMLLKRGLRAVILPTENRSDIVLWNEGEIIIPWFQVDAVDATGAGDAFAAGLSVGLAEGYHIADAARFGSATAALKTLKKGAQAGMPSRRRVNTLLSLQNYVTRNSRPL